MISNKFRNYELVLLRDNFYFPIFRIVIFLDLVFSLVIPSSESPATLA